MREPVAFLDKVREDQIFLGVDGDSKEEVLRNIADCLVKKGVAKESFPDALLAREEEYPTGLQLGGELNIAIPHAHPEHIKEITVTIAVPKNPVIFMDMGDHETEVPVQVIVCLTLQKLDDNIKMLPALMDFFAKEENLKAILACKEPQQVMALLRGEDIPC